MSRTKRFVSGVALGYTQQILVTATGLWLTPFLLHRIGQHDYGLWLVGLQVLTWLTLMDFGIVALLPRETAYAFGRAGNVVDATELPPVVARAWRVVLWQWPLVAIVAASLFLFLPAGSQSVRGPIGSVLIAFTVTFPARVFRAVLEGLQDLAFLGSVQILTWMGGTLLSICLILAHFHLYALADGWAATQLSASAACFLRLKFRYPTALPSRGTKATTGHLRTHLGQGFWISLAQVAQVLLGGSDLIVIGKVLGSGPVVPYACSGKLTSVLANQPSLLMHAASPGLAAIKSTGDRGRAFDVAVNLTLGMLILSGAVVCIVLAVNRAFVTWWVGEQQYAGFGVTSLFAFAMILRHWNTTAVYSIFCFGLERRISITTLLDGVVTVGASLFLVRAFGLLGAPLGSICGVCAISLPANLHALSKESGRPFLASLEPIWPWLWRFALLSAGSMILANRWDTATPLATALTALSVCLVYLAFMFPMLIRSPLAVYLPGSMFDRFTVLSPRPAYTAVKE